MLMIAKVVAVPSQTTVVLIVIVHVMRLMTAMRLILEGLAQVHLRLEILVRTAIEQAVVVAVIVVVVHCVWIMSGRIGAGRTVR